MGSWCYWHTPLLPMVVVVVVAVAMLVMLVLVLAAVRVLVLVLVLIAVLVLVLVLVLKVRPCDWICVVLKTRGPLACSGRSSGVCFACRTNWYPTLATSTAASCTLSCPSCTAACVASSSSTGACCWACCTRLIAASGVRSAALSEHRGRAYCLSASLCPS
jgi:hypothetical protein